MNPNIEDKVRAALREAADTITPATLRQPDLPRPRRHHLAIPLVVATAVICVLAGVGIGAAVNRTPAPSQDAASAPSVQPGTTLALSHGAADVDGIAIPIPSGWTITEMAPLSNARRLCITDAAGSNTQTCTTGMVVIVASTAANGTAAFIPTRIPTVCKANQVVLYEPNARLDTRPAVVYTSRCDGTGPTSIYWQLADSSLTITSPMSDHPEKYESIVNSIDLSNWTHRP